MRKIDTTSDNYNFVANLFSTMVGFGASCLVGAFCNSIIENDPNYGKHRFSMTLCREGLKLIAVGTVSTEVRKNIDDIANAWNEIVDILSVGQAVSDVHKTVVDGEPVYTVVNEDVSEA